MLRTRQCSVYLVFAAVIIAPLVSLLANGFKEIGVAAKARPRSLYWRQDEANTSLHDPRADSGTFENSRRQADFSSLGKQRLPEGAMKSTFSIAASGKQLDRPLAWSNLDLEGNSTDPGVFGEGLNTATAAIRPVFPFPFAQDLQDTLKPQGTVLYSRTAAVLTPAHYSAALQWGISAQLRSNPGVTPVIRARWHTAEQYVAAAAALRDDRRIPFFFVVLAEYAPVKTQRPSQLLREKGLALVPATQGSLADDNGKLLPYPFSVPTPLQLLQSAFGTDYAVKELGIDKLSSGAQSLDSFTSGRGANDSAPTGYSDSSLRSEPSHMRETTSAFLRWIPFGLTRTLPAAGVVGELPVDTRTREVSLIEPPENEEFFVERLSRTLPRRWLKAPDGRRLVFVLNDQITECRSLLHLAVNSSSGGTPVFVENSEGLDPRKLLLRLKDERIADRAVLRVPKADDIKTFLKRKEVEIAEELASEKKALETVKRHTEERKEHLLEDSGRNGHLDAHSSRKTEQPLVLVLNPFDEYLLRFNYTEVSDLTSYADTLAMELRNEPLEISIGGESRRVAVMILSEPPETESELGPAWMRLNRLIQMAIAISMIVGLLCCLCMWRMMLLLKQR